MYDIIETGSSWHRKIAVARAQDMPTAADCNGWETHERRPVHLASRRRLLATTVKPGRQRFRQSPGFSRQKVPFQSWSQLFPIRLGQSDLRGATKASTNPRDCDEEIAYRRIHPHILQRNAVMGRDENNLHASCLSRHWKAAS